MEKKEQYSDEYWEKRIANITQNISMRQIIDYFKVFAVSPGTETQVQCPFHSKDNHPSAKIYDTNTMYCWVCHKTWNVITFVEDYNNLSFKKALSFLEETFNLDKVDVSIAYTRNTNIFSDTLNNKKDLDFEKYFEKINNLLLRSKTNLNFDKYVKFYVHYDNLYSDYQNNKYKDDLAMQTLLSSFYSEILKYV